MNAFYLGIRSPIMLGITGYPFNAYDFSNQALFISEPQSAKYNMRKWIMPIIELDPYANHPLV
jgi:hypothetical protein